MGDQPPTHEDHGAIVLVGPYCAAHPLFNALHLTALLALARLKHTLFKSVDQPASIRQTIDNEDPASVVRQVNAIVLVDHHSEITNARAQLVDSGAHVL